MKILLFLPLQVLHSITSAGYFRFYHSSISKWSKAFHQLFMMPSAPLNSKMVMMLGENDFDLNQQGRPAIIKVPQTFSDRWKKSFHTGFESSKKAFTQVWHLHQSHMAIRDYHHTDRLLLTKPQHQPFPSCPERERCPQDCMAMPVFPRSA